MYTKDDKDEAASESKRERGQVIGVGEVDAKYRFTRLCDSLERWSDENGNMQCF